MATQSSVSAGMDLQPRFCEGRAMRVAGLRGFFTSARLREIPEQWKRLVAFGAVTGRVDRIEYAVAYLLPDGCDYLSGFEVESGAGLPAEFSAVALPAQRYAVFTHAGHVSEMNRTFGAILHEWVPETGFVMSNDDRGIPFCLERYGEGFDPVTGVGDIEIWVPGTAKSR